MHGQTEPPKYRLRVTAGPEYDRSTHQQVAVNDKTLRFDGDRATVDVGVHIQNYSGILSLSLASVQTKDKLLLVAVGTNNRQDTLIIPQRPARISHNRYTPTTNTQYPAPSPRNRISMATT